MWSNIRFILIAIPLSFICCSKKKPIEDKQTVKHTQKVEPASWDTIPIGDIDNDKRNDTAFIYTPEYLTELDKDGNVSYSIGYPNREYYNTVNFSCRVSSLTVKNSVWGTIANIGDLNKDGYDEIIFSPDWFTSSSSYLCVFTYKYNKWKLITRVSWHKSFDEPLEGHIIQIGQKYFLKGTHLVDGDEVGYKCEITFQ